MVRQMSGILTPYQRIVANEKLGLGVVLSAEEVAEMARDDAILEMAINDDLQERSDDD